MYRGFNLSLERKFFKEENFKYLYLRKVGFKSLTCQKATIKGIINSFIDDDGFLDGSKMQANWFPQIKADVFISHSHKDRELALTLAGWLRETFGLTAFIDSCVWGYANDLLKMIDNKYCYQ